MFPSTWDPSALATGPSSSKKRKKTFLEDTDARAGAGLPTVEFQSSLQQTILRRLNADYPSPSPSELSLDHILTRVSYRGLLENLFSNVEPEVPDVPVLSKAYEETFMRQALAGEQSCVMGDQCECMHIDKSSPFIGVEFRLPQDPQPPQMCLLCSRATTQKCFYDMCYAGKPTRGLIQRHGNIFGQPGEYAVECMLLCPRAIGLASMPVPCMSHQRNRYSVSSQGGIKRLKQHRVRFEDYQPPQGR
jgi:hypothetical protein